MLNKQITTVFPVTVEENGIMIFRQKVSVVEDGTEISHGFIHRQINPGDDYSKEEPGILDLCKKVHTKAVVDAYKKATNEATP